jgi:acetate---CoA ligase (ADP-forming)
MSVVPVPGREIEDEVSMPAVGARNGADAFDRLCRARTLAVIGASPRPDTLRGRALNLPRKHGFGAPGQLFTVNPSYGDVDGVACVPTVDELPDGVDAALIVVPIEAVVDVVEACGRRAIPNVVIFSAGFAEVGERGRDIQDELVRVARAGNVRVLGPNCSGVINLLEDRALTFASEVARWDRPLSGHSTAFVSQSGAIGMRMLGYARRTGLQLSHVITTGNEADLSWSDAAAWLAGQDEVRSVLGYLESIRDGDTFLGGLRSLREAGKDVVLLKSGRTAPGARTTSAHTGTLAGDDDVFDAICRDYAVVRVTCFEDLASAAAVLAGPRSNGRRIAIVTGSGGLAAILADTCADHGLEVPQLSQHTRAAIAPQLPAFASTANPVDVTGMFVQSPAMREGVVESLAASGEIDSIGLFIGGLTDEDSLDYIGRVHGSITVPLAVCWTETGVALSAELNRRGIPSFETGAAAVAGLALLGRAHEACSRVLPARAAQPAESTVEVMLDADDPLSSLHAAGVRVVARRVVGADVLLAVMAAQAAPVFVKSIEPDVAHKTEAGAVIGPVGGDDLDQVRALLTRRPKARRFEIQELVPVGAELLLTARLDSTFGYVAVLAAGGIWAEILADSCVLIPPITPDTVRVAAQPTKVVNALLDGVRGAAPVDPGRVAAMAQRLIDCAAAWGLSTLECNPVIVEKGSNELLAVDVLCEAGRDTDGRHTDQEV